MSKDKEDNKRTEAFKKDSSFLAKEDLGNWAVFGDKSDFVYISGLEENKAKKVAAELLKNRIDLKEFEESL